MVNNRKLARYLFWLGLVFFPCCICFRSGICLTDVILFRSCSIYRLRDMEDGICDAESDEDEIHTLHAD